MVKISKFEKMDAVWVALIYVIISVLLVSIFGLSFKKWEMHWVNLLIIIPFTCSMFMTFYLHRPYSGVIAVGVPLFMRSKSMGQITTNDILGIIAFGTVFIAVFASWVLNIVFVIKKKDKK